MLAVVKTLPRLRWSRHCSGTLTWPPCLLTWRERERTRTAASTPRQSKRLRQESLPRRNSLRSPQKVRTLLIEPDSYVDSSVTKAVCPHPCAWWYRDDTLVIIWLYFYYSLYSFSRRRSQSIAALTKKLLSSHRIYAAVILALTTPNVSSGIPTRDTFVYVRLDTQENTVKQVLPL